MARGEKGRRPGKRGRPSEDTGAEPAPPGSSEPLFRDTVRGSGPVRGDRVLEDPAPASNPLPGAPVRASGPFPAPGNTAPASAPPFCGAVRLPLPRSHHPVLDPPLPAEPAPEPDTPVPAPSPGRGASPAARRPRAWAPEAGRRSDAPPFADAPGIPGALHASHALEVLDAPGLFGAPGVACPLLAAEPGTTPEAAPEPETGPQATPETGPETEPGPGPEGVPDAAAPEPPAIPESPTEAECGRSKSSPIASSAVGRPAESVTFTEFVPFAGFTGLTEPVEPIDPVEPGGRCGGVEPAGPGARRASVLMHPPFPRTRATVCSPAGRCTPALVRARAGVLLPCSYTDRRPPRSHPARHKIKDTETKSSRARIPAAADRHPGRGRTTGGVSSVRARHSTG